MKANSISALILTANLGWCGILWHRAAQGGGHLNPGLPAPPSPVADIPAAPSPSRPAQGFRWDQIESGDYRAYMANLKAIGCPTQTVFDIVAADVHAVFQKRLAAGRSDRSCPAAALAAEEAGVLRQLGIPAGPSFVAETDRLEPEGLSPATQCRMLAAQRAALLSSIQDREPTEEELGALADLSQRIEDRLQRFASPGELEAFEIEYSEGARSLRDALGDVEVSDAEFRALWALRKQGLGPGEPGPADEERIVQILGLERYKLFAGLTGSEGEPQEGDLSPSVNEQDSEEPADGLPSQPGATPQPVPMSP